VNNNHNNTSIAILQQGQKIYKLSTQTASTMIIRWIKGDGSSQLETTINQYFNSDNNINDEEECHALWKGDQFMLQKEATSTMIINTMHNGGGNNQHETTINKVLQSWQQHRQQRRIIRSMKRRLVHVAMYSTTTTSTTKQRIHMRVLWSNHKIKWWINYSTSKVSSGNLREVAKGKLEIWNGKTRLSLA
jgi:hypothetical protein